MESDQVSRGAAPNMGDILTAEFEYIAQTAFQANEDRARVTNLYLITLGGLVAAILADTVGAALSGIYWVLVVLFGLLAANSVLTLLQLVRLRQAWRESLLAMNQIKDFYQTRYPELGAAFRWKTETVPPADKLWSIGFLLALQVALLGGVVLGVAAYLIGLIYGQPLLGVAILVGILFALGQMLLYRRLLGWQRYLIGSTTGNYPTP